jgi:hypothetical protein
MGSVLSITYEDMQNVTPSDTALVPGNRAAGFGADAAGTVTITTVRGTKITRTILAGLIYDVAITKIWNTSTTATGIYCVYAEPYTATPSQ